MDMCVSQSACGSQRRSVGVSYLFPLCRVWDSNSGLQALYVVAIKLGPSYPVLIYQNNTKNYLKRLLKFLLCIYLKLDFLLTIQSKQTVDIDKQIQLPFIK